MISPVSRFAVKRSTRRRPVTRSSQKPRDSHSAVTAKLSSSISAPVTAPSRAPSVPVARRNRGAMRMRRRVPGPSESIATRPSSSSLSAGSQRAPRNPALTQMPLSRVRSSSSSAWTIRPILRLRHTTGMPIFERIVFTPVTSLPRKSGTRYYRRAAPASCAAIPSVRGFRLYIFKITVVYTGIICYNTIKRETK